ncbi:MAG: hypothetical protein JWQ09_662 [Segetibacter sp.]|nr:hypothetical protein [Segetibacter sp.]
MRKYFIHDGTSELGPFTLEDLQLQKISKKTPIWFDGLSEWSPADKIPELAHLITTPPPFAGSTPPPITKTPEFEREVIIEEPVANKKRLTLPLSAIAVIIGVFVIWFISSKVTTIDDVQQKQQEEIIEKNAKEEERQRVNEELSSKNMNYRNNWSKYITVTNGDYRASGLGGISGLEVMVVNNTDYLLDEVDAVVTYVKANGDTWKLINIPVTNIPAHSRKIVPVEDVDRSTSVNVSTNGIISKKMHFYYSSEYNSGNNEDPYFFK